MMATRVMTTGRSLNAAWERLVRTLATWSPSTAFARLHDFVWPLGWTLRERLVRLLWLPFWLATDLAGPRMHRRFVATSERGPASQRLVSYLASVQRRQLLVRAAILVVRAIALAAMIAVAWAGWAARHGPRVDGSVIFVIALALIAMALYFSWRYRPDLRETARMLDRSFSLSDRISTAVDHLDARADKSNGKPHVAYLQIAEATNTVAILSKHPALRVRPPIREVVLVAAAALLFLSLYLVRGTGAGLPGAGNPAVPAFVSARDRLQQQPVQPNQPADTSENAPTIEDVQKRADDSASATEDLLTLADALDDNPLTAPIADSIRAGDYESAAAQLNAVASQVSQLSPEIRSDLADQLDKAADAMTGAHPDLQDATGNAADGLRSDPQTAESSLNDLSEQISATGKAVESQQDLANDMRDARQAGQSGSQHEDTRPEPGASQCDPGQGEQQIAGDGGDAAGGQNDQPKQGQQTGGSSPGDSPGQQDGGNQPSQSGSGESAGQAGGSSASGQSGDQTGDSSSQASGGSAQSGDNPQAGDTGGSAENSRTGSGAGSGQGQDGEDQSSNGAEQQPGTGENDTPDPNMISGDGSGGSDPNAAADQQHSTITLSRSPTESGLQSGGAASSSSGSGSGAAAGPGSVEQGDVGAAGPDSNRVPKRYRQIVEDYFSDEP